MTTNAARVNRNRLSALDHHPRRVPGYGVACSGADCEDSCRGPAMRAEFCRSATGQPDLIMLDAIHGLSRSRWIQEGMPEKVDGALCKAVSSVAEITELQHHAANTILDQICRRQKRRGFSRYGGMAERFKAPVLKTGVGASSPWVRIPLPPPQHKENQSLTGLFAAFSNGCHNRRSILLAVFAYGSAK